jgi:arabinose-5-phosphate isomerase
VVGAIGDGGLGAVAVVDDADHLLGIVTDGDLRRAVQRTQPVDLGMMTAANIMTAGPTTVGPQVLAYDALQRMEDRPSQISVLPVVDNGNRCVGVVRVHDIVRAGV